MQILQCFLRLRSWIEKVAKRKHIFGGEIMVKLTLDEKLIKDGISRYQLAKDTGIQYQIIDKYYKNKVTRYDRYILDKICTVLNCDISEIITFR